MWKGVYNWFGKAEKAPRRNQDDLLIKLAKKSNENAQYLRQKLDKISGVKFLYPTHGNEIFVEMSKDHYKKFKEVNYEYRFHIINR